MKPEYEEWILNFQRSCFARVMNITSFPEEERIGVAVHGLCRVAAEAMIRDFPELIKKRGHYGPYEHWWLQTTDGEIIDPTKPQFENQELKYKEHTGPDPVGKCMNCGRYVWNYEFTSSACSQDCLDDLTEEYNSYADKTTRR